MRQRIAMLFQGAALFDSLDVGDQRRLRPRRALLGQDDATRRSTSASRGRSRSSACPGIEDMWPADFSGGMKKRVGLARAIAVQPEVLLYDEPTTGLDPINTARVNHLIMGLQRTLNVTSIVVTHDMKSAFTISDELAMVQGGRIIATERPRNFAPRRTPACTTSSKASRRSKRTSRRCCARDARAAGDGPRRHGFRLRSRPYPPSYAGHLARTTRGGSDRTARTF